MGRSGAMGRIVFITGSCNCYDQAAVTAMMSKHLQEGDTVWTGGTSGVETLAAKQAVAWNMSHEFMLASWREDGEIDPLASWKRYMHVAENCNVVLVMWDGTTAESHKMIMAAVECCRELHVYPTNPHA